MGFFPVNTFTICTIRSRNKKTVEWGLEIPGSKSMQWFIEDQAFFRSFDSALRPPPLHPSPVRKMSLFLNLPVCSQSSIFAGDVEEREWARSQIIWPRESLAHYNSFSIFCGESAGWGELLSFPPAVVLSRVRSVARRKTAAIGGIYPLHRNEGGVGRLAKATFVFLFVYLCSTNV
jgi:hypothetical protein